MNRRKFIQTTSGLIAVPIIASIYTWQIEPFWLEFVHLPLHLKNLPVALEGKTLMQLSDLHVGNRFSRDYLKSSLVKAQAYKPDIVVYTGDFVSYENEQQFEQLQDVMANAVHGELGTFAVLGNHDYGENWNEPVVAGEIVNILEKASIKVLRNQEARVEGLEIIGLDDFWGTNYAPKEVLKPAKEKGRIILCHNPDVADESIWNGVEGWILAGHTHGGQVKPPFLEPPMLPVKNKSYTSGGFKLDNGLSMYINRALGHLWQVRFNVRPEITIFTLNRS